MTPKWTAAAAAILTTALTGLFPANAYAAPSDQDKNYLIAAHQFNLAQINSGGLARLKATAPAIRDLASKIVTDHVALDEALIPVASQFGVPLPATPDEAQQTKQAELEAMSAGSDFDREWVVYEQNGHTTAMSQGQAEATAGTEPAIVKVAQDAGVVLALHHASLTKSSAAASPPSHVDSGSGGLADPRRTLIPLAVTGIGLLLILAGVTLRRRSTL